MIYQDQVHFACQLNLPQICKVDFLFKKIKIKIKIGSKLHANQISHKASAEPPTNSEF